MVFVGKEYFKINHLLPLLFNLAWGCTFLGKNVIPSPALKEFLMRCLKQFIIYIWMSVSPIEMNAYLIKIVEETGIDIDLQWIMWQPYFWKSVRMTLTLSKWGLESPPGLPKLQSSIAWLKTPCIGAFFISLKSY
jgi:hypothetical protein